MNHEFLEYQLFGLISFGMTHEEIRLLMSEKPESGMLHPEHTRTDHYLEAGIKCYFDRFDRLEAVRFFKPGQIQIEGKDPFFISAEELKQSLRDKNQSLIEEGKERIVFMNSSLELVLEKGRPHLPPQSVLCARKHYFFLDEGIQDPEQATSFRFQVAFVESILPEERKFDSFENALSHVFRKNREFGIIHWNSIPFRISYRDHLPSLLQLMLPVLAELSNAASGKTKVNLRLSDLWWEIEFRWQNEMVLIKSEFLKVPGRHESNLNQWSAVRISIEDFLREWKIPLNQCLEALKRGKIKLTTSEGKFLLGLLKKVASKITMRGISYAEQSD